MNANTLPKVRFHGQASGLQLLGRNERTDDRIEGGVWYVLCRSCCPHLTICRHLPMARIWPPSSVGLERYYLEDPSIKLPSQEMQDELIKLYFTNIHPVFPVIHKSHFLSEYESRCANLV